jgi:FAD/FMN-containing dehydrogenase
MYLSSKYRCNLMEDKLVTELKNQVRGDVVLPQDEDYDKARKVYNAMIDKQPAVIVRCTGVADVIASVKTARAAGIDIAIRGGGHSVPGFGTADQALVIDLNRMKGIRVNPTTKTAWVEGGCTLGDVYHATLAFGLTTPGGIISTTGVGGLTLGGGIGYIARSAGLSVDNLLAADVVLADGSFVTASETENRDLLWALCGGGGNFGVVTNFQFRLHEVKDVVAGPMFFEIDDAPEIMRTYETYITDAPRQLGAFFAWQIAPPLPFIPKDRHGDTLCAIVVCWTGQPKQAKAVFAPLRDVAPVVAEHVGPMSFSALNSAFDGLVGPGLQHYWKTLFSNGLTDATIEAHTKYGPQVPVVNSTIHIYSINGAVHDIATDATAFGHRDAKYATVIAGMWPDPSQNEANIRWVRDYHKALEPHSQQGGYINFTSGDDLDRAAVNFGSNYEQLRNVKAKYDPDNVFHINQNIKPA